MAKRVNPTLNDYQERILIGKAHLNATTAASLIKTAIGEMITRMTPMEIKIYTEHYDKMTDIEKSNPDK